MRRLARTIRPAARLHESSSGWGHRAVLGWRSQPATRLPRDVGSGKRIPPSRLPLPPLAAILLHSRPLAPAGPPTPGGAAGIVGGRRVNGWLDPAAAGAVLTPLVIFVAEMCVVTIGTTRTIFVSRGMKAPAALLGVFECSLWLLAVGQVFQNLGDLGCSAAYAGGFALGNYLGVLLEEKLAVGSVLLRVITRRDAAPLIRDLAAADYGVTRLDGRGAVGPVQVVLTVVRRRQLGHVVGVVKRFDPGAFYSVDDLQSAAAGVFPLRRRGRRGWLPWPFPF